jgi:hypothetical protein
MFKTVILYRGLGVLILLSALWSCDGRKSLHQALKEDIQNFKKEVFLEVHFPEADFVSHSDTLLDSGYRIQLKTIPDLNNSVVVKSMKDDVEIHRHYRNFIFDMHLSREDAMIITETFDKNRLEALISKSKNRVSLTGHVLKSINVNLNKSSKIRFVIDLIYYEPQSLEERHLEIILDPRGHFDLQLS